MKNGMFSNFVLDEKKVFLLHYLRHRKINWATDTRIKNLFEDYEKVISDLKEHGYLRDDDHFGFLEEMGVADLKIVSKRFNLPSSGCKKELIERIINNTTPEQRANVCTDQYFILTSSGLEIDKEYIQNKKMQNANLKETFLQEVKSGNYVRAALERADAYSQMLVPLGIGVDWSNNEEIQNHSKSEQKRLKNYDFSDLNNSDAYKEILFQILYYDDEIEHNLFTSISKFINSEGERINCPDMEFFFKEKNYMPTETEKIFVYLDTKRFNEFQLGMQKTLKSEKYRPLPKGEFHISDQTIDFWKKRKEDCEEFERLSCLGIKGFPKTLQTFQKHKEKNDEKYQSWISVTS